MDFYIKKILRDSDEWECPERNAFDLVENFDGEEEL